LFTVDRENIAHAVSVTVLVRNADQAIIESKNLTEGNLIITEGNYNLPDGAHVIEGSAK
jgi:hypothetical protein